MLKDYILKECDKIKSDIYDRDTIASFVLYELYQEAPYFKNLYKDKIKINTYDDDTIIKVATGSLNNVPGKMYRMDNTISSLSKEDMYEDQFLEHSNSILRKKDINKIKKYAQLILASETKSDFIEKVKEQLNKDSSIFYTTKLFLNQSYNDEFEYFSNILSEIDNKNNKRDENYYKITNLFKEPDTSFISRTVRDDIFKEMKQKYLYQIKTQLSQFKVMENETLPIEKEIKGIKNTVYKQFPFLKELPNKNELEFFMLESKTGVNNLNSFSSKNEIERDELSFKISEDLKEPQKNKNIIDIIQESFCSFEESRCLDLEGMSFLSEESLYQMTDLKNIYILAKKNNETVGALSILKQKNNNVLKIHEICVKSNYRGLGIPKELYKSLAKFSIDNNLIITNSMYTNDGKRALPNIKDEVRKEFPDFMLIDKTYRNKDEKKEELIGQINNYLLTKIKQNPLFQFNKVKTAYKTIIQDINESTNFKQKEIKELLEKAFNNEEKKNKIKQKI